jgi:ribosome-associated protein
MMGAMRTVQIRDDEIRLGQFLKLADLVTDGAEVKPLVGAGEVAVNGRTETRRGRRLGKGDVVTVRGEQARVG